MLTGVNLLAEPALPRTHMTRSPEFIARASRKSYIRSTKKFLFLSVHEFTCQRIRGLLLLHKIRRFTVHVSEIRKWASERHGKPLIIQAMTLFRLYIIIPV